MILFVLDGEGVDDDGNVVCVAANNVDELVFRCDGSVVDANGIHFTEAEFGPLCHKAFDFVFVFIIEFFFVHQASTFGCAVDDDVGVFDCFFRVVDDVDAEFLEVFDFFFSDC